MKYHDRMMSMRMTFITIDARRIFLLCSSLTLFNLSQSFSFYQDSLSSLIYFSYYSLLALYLFYRLPSALLSAFTSFFFLSKYLMYLLTQASYFLYEVLVYSSVLDSIIDFIIVEVTKFMHISIFIEHLSILYQLYLHRSTKIFS